MEWNSELFRIVNGWAGTYEWLDAVMVFLTLWTKYYVTAILLGYWVLKRGAEARRAANRTVVSVAVASGVAFVLVRVIKWVTYYPRPLHSDGVNQLIPDLMTSSFPSSHAAQTFAVAVTMWLYDRTWGKWLLGLAAVVSFSRIYVGAHYPLDVIAGAVLGSGIGWGVVRWLGKRQGKRREKVAV